MSGTGNLLLKRKTGGSSTVGIPATGLTQAMPVLHLGGLARADANGVPLENYSNRLWVGMSGYGTGIVDNESGVAIQQQGDTTNYSSTRPIWMGAEIRAHTAIANGVLKANWVTPSDYIVATQKSIYEWATATFGAGSAAATSILVAEENASANTHYIPFVSGTSGQQAVKIDHTSTPLTYLPSSNTLTATNFAGALTGNASTATALATARNIALTGDVTGTVSFDGTANVSISTTIAADSVALGTDTTGNYVAAGAVSGSGLSGSVSSEGGTFTVTSNATNANTPSTLVFRDASNNFSAGTITAALAGNATTASTATTATNVTATANINSGAENRILFGVASAGSLAVQYDTPSTNQPLRYDSTTSTLWVQNLNVVGTEYTFIKDVLTVAAPLFTLNSDLPKYNDVANGISATATSNTETSENGRFILNRGATADAELRFNETTHKWESTHLTEITTTNISTITQSVSAGFTVAYTKALNRQSFGVGESISLSGFTTNGASVNIRGYNNTWKVATTDGNSTTTSGSFTVVEKTVNIRDVVITESIPSGTLTLVVRHDFTIIPPTGVQNITIAGTDIATVNRTYTGANVTAATATTLTFTFPTGATGIAAGTADAGASVTTLTMSANSAAVVHTVNAASNTKLTGVNVYPLLIADGQIANKGSSGNDQYIDILHVNDLRMDGFWSLNASITTDLSLSGGGLILPTGANVPAGTFNSSANMGDEARIFWESDADLLHVGTGVNNTYKTFVDQNSAQTLTNKTWNSVTIGAAYGGTGKSTYASGDMLYAATANPSSLTALTAGTTGYVLTIESSVPTWTLNTGTGSVVRASSPTLTTPVIGAATGTSLVLSGDLTINGGDLVCASAGFNLLAAATTLTIGGANSTTTTINGSTITGTTSLSSVFSSTAVAVTAFANASTSLTLGNATGMTTINGDLTIGGYDLTFGPSSDTTRQSIRSADTNTVTPAIYDLPNIASGNIVIANATSYNSDKFILVGAGTGASPTTASTFVDPINVVVGGVFFKNETTETTTRYPIAFLGAALADNSGTFGAIASDSTSVTGYIKTNWNVADPLGHTSVGNASYGLMYEVGNGTGTLYCDYIGATLDCGTYG